MQLLSPEKTNRSKAFMRPLDRIFHFAFRLIIRHQTWSKENGIITSVWYMSFIILAFSLKCTYSKPIVLWSRFISCGNLVKPTNFGNIHHECLRRYKFILCQKNDFWNLFSKKNFTYRKYIYIIMGWNCKESWCYWFTWLPSIFVISDYTSVFISKAYKLIWGDNTTRWPSNTCNLSEHSNIFLAVWRSLSLSVSSLKVWVSPKE